MSKESLYDEIAIVDRKIEKVEDDISSVDAAIKEAEGHVLKNNKLKFWEPKLHHLRDEKKQLRDLVLLKEQQHTGKHVFLSLAPWDTLSSGWWNVKLIRRMKCQWTTPGSFSCVQEFFPPLMWGK